MRKFSFCVFILLTIACLNIHADYTICNSDIELPAPPVEERITTRTYPSVFQAGNPVIGIDGLTSADFYSNPTELLTKDEYIIIHDLHFSDFVPYEHAFIRYGLTEDQPFPGLSTLIGVEDIELAKASHQNRLGLNPNYVFLSGDGFYVGELNEFPTASNLLLRGDITGNLIMYGGHNPYLNLLNPEVQELIIEKTVNFATCGLFDGLFIDSFTSFTNEKNGRIDRSQMSVEMGAKIMDALVHIFQEIRKRVPDNFLILVNAGGAGKPSRFTEYINGSFMECTREPHRHYNHSDLIELEDTLLWNEENFRYPQINCLEGFGLPDELPDGPNNQRWMRVFTTLSLTHSDGYVLYNTGGAYIGEPDHEHIWYDFWDANLGRPIGGNETKGQLYENREGLFIREFTNGWAVYNRSGQAQEINLSIQTTGVASGITGFKHTVPDLDGEMYLKTDVHADVNGDGVVNIQDLVIVANALGEAEPDLNGDGVVNIQDLVIVANAF